MRSLGSRTDCRYSRLPSVEPSLIARTSKSAYDCRKTLSRLSGRYGMALNTGIPTVRRAMDLSISLSHGAANAGGHGPHCEVQGDIAGARRSTCKHLAKQKRKRAPVFLPGG